MDDDAFRQFRLAYSIRFIRSIMLASVFIYVVFGLIRSNMCNDNGLDIWSLRIGIVLFILSIYAISYTEMFKKFYEYWLALLVIINSINLLGMGILVEGINVITASPFTIIPYALIMIVVNYIFPMRFNIAVISGTMVSTPYLCVSILSGSIEHLMSTLMMLVVLNVLLSLNLYSNEKMLKELWINR